MHYNKRCILTAAAAMTAFSSVPAVQYIAYAAEAPTDVHLIADEISIDIEDIPGDRTCL